MSNLSTLNPNQQKAVLTTQRYVRVVAGAGSGKTRVLIERVAHLIQDLGVHPGSILAITFTNKAANEMKERLDRMLGSGAAGVHISTIHSLCVRILREDSPSMDLPRNFTVLDQEDQKSILKEAYKEIGLDKQKYSLNSMLDYIGNNKGAEITVERALELAGSHYGEQEKAKVYAYYCARQKALFALDFDDLLLVTVKMFSTYPDILRKWQRRFNFLHVDEFQDIDHVQYKLIRQMAGAENQVYVVGDPDQTIYTWRGADVNIIMNFEKDYKPTETIILDQNYRSTPHILNGANSMIKHNQNRVEKALFTNKKSPDKVTHCAFADEDQESHWIIDMAIKRHEEKKIPLKDMAILYRSNYLSRSMEKACLDAQLPYVIYGGTRFYDRAEIKDMLSYLRMLTHGDDLAFTRIVNTPKRGIGQKTLDTLRDQAKKNKRTLYNELKEQNPFSGKVGSTLDQFVTMIERFKSLLGQKPILEILETVANDSGLRLMYEANHEVDRLENIKELINDVITFQNQYPEAGLDEYLQMVSLYGDKNDLTSGDYLQMMTIHAAKGLEFDTVFVIGLSEGIFPSERAMSERRGLEEERRLAYVAYTRAKNKLFLSEVSGYSFVLTRVRSRSRFIDEIEDPHIDHIGVNYDFKHAKEVHMEKSVRPESLFADEMSKRAKVPYKKGELIHHSTFGDGIILSLDGGLAEIAFDYPNGVKKMMVVHPAITKIKKESEE